MTTEPAGSTDNIPVRHLCSLPHRGDQLPQVTPPDYCCPAHNRRLRDQIVDIHRLWRLLPDIGLSARDGAGRCGANSTPPVRLDVLALLDPHTHPDGDIPPAAAQLQAWAALVADERHLRTPTTPDAALTLLAVHHDHTIRQPWLPDYASELRRIHHALRHLAGETRAIIATCHAEHPDPQLAADGVECGGPLVHQPVGDVAVVCLRCGDAWSQGGVDLALAQMSLTDEREQDAG